MFSQSAEVVRQVLIDIDGQDGGLLHYASAAGLPSVVQAVLNAGASLKAYRWPMASPIDMETNSFARVMISGTALDVCSDMRERCIASSRRGHENISPEGKIVACSCRVRLTMLQEYKFMLEMYDAIKTLLTKK